MSKWCDAVGFVETVEYEPGSWEEEVIEKKYFGDVLDSRWKRQNSGGVNDDINLSNQISIVADPYLLHHCASIGYVCYMDARWKVTDVSIQYPRLVLTVGGEYNGNTPRSSE